MEANNHTHNIIVPPVQKWSNVDSLICLVYVARLSEVSVLVNSSHVAAVLQLLVVETGAFSEESCCFKVDCCTCIMLLSSKPNLRSKIFCIHVYVKERILLLALSRHLFANFLLIYNKLRLPKGKLIRCDIRKNNIVIYSFTIRK